MKKLSIFFTAALALGFAACSDDENLGTMQQNPQLPEMEVGNLKVVPSSVLKSQEINLETAKETMEDIPVLSISEKTNLPAGYEIEGTMEFSTSKDFTKYESIALKTIDDELYAPIYLWQQAYITLRSKNPQATLNFVRFTLRAIKGNSVYQLKSPYQYNVRNYGQEDFNETEDTGDTPNFWWCATEVKVTPESPANIIQDEYFININGTPVLMTSVSPEDVYKSSKFQAVFKVLDNPVSIIVSTTDNAGQNLYYGLIANNPDNIEEGGTLQMSTSKDDVNPLVVDDPGTWMLVVDMENLTYELSNAYEQLIATGSSFGSNYCILEPNSDFTQYTGIFGSRNNKMKIGDQEGTPNFFWGAIASDLEPSLEGELASTNSSESVNLIVLDAGTVTAYPCYWVTVSLSNKTWEALRIDSFSIIGAFNGWKEETEVVLTQTNNAVGKRGLEWEGDLTISNGDEFKIRTNRNWEGADFGGTVSNLIEHGGNIIWNEGEGTFHVTLNLASRPYTLTAVPK